MRPSKKLGAYGALYFWPSRSWVSASSGIGVEGVQTNGMLYQPATDRPYARRLGNGRERMVTLDYDGRIHRLTSAGVHDALLDYDSTDTLDLLTDYIVPALGASFTYDATDRLKTVSRSGDAQSFGWDKSGNRTSHSRAGAANTYASQSTSNRLASGSRAQPNDQLNQRRARVADWHARSSDSPRKP